MFISQASKQAVVDFIEAVSQNNTAQKMLNLVNGLHGDCVSVFRQVCFIVVVVISTKLSRSCCSYCIGHPKQVFFIITKFVVLFLFLCFIKSSHRGVYNCYCYFLNNVDIYYI
jgi:hypothetical protein